MIVLLRVVPVLGRGTVFPVRPLSLEAERSCNNGSFDDSDPERILCPECRCCFGTSSSTSNNAAFRYVGEGSGIPNNFLPDDEFEGVIGRARGLLRSKSLPPGDDGFEYFLDLAGVCGGVL